MLEFCIYTLPTQNYQTRPVLPESLSSLKPPTIHRSANFISPVSHLGAPINVDKVPVVRRGTRSKRTRIAGSRVNARDDLDIRRGHSHVVAAGNPVLGTRVTESRGHRRELRHCVVSVRDTPLGIDVGDVLRQRKVAHARLAVGILHFYINVNSVFLPDCHITLISGIKRKVLTIVTV